MTLQGVASPPLPIGCGRELLRLYIPVQGHKGTVSDVRHTSSSKERTNEARAIAIPLCPRRDQGPLYSSARASRGTSRRRVTKPVHVRTKARSKRTSTLRETGAERSQEGNASKKTPKVWPRMRSSWRDRRVRRLGGRRGKNDAGDSRTTETYRTVKVVTTVERHLHNLCVLIEDGEFCTE